MTGRPHRYKRRGIPDSFRPGRCKIRNVDNGPNLELVPRHGREERSWLPMIIAALVVVVAGAIVLAVLEHGQRAATVTPVTAAEDPYAPSLPVTGVTMSEAGNLAGGKVTYVDGHIANRGNRTVSGIVVQVLFYDGAGEVTQNETHPLNLIRMREPYVDVGPVASAPLAPGDAREFRLIFDKLSPDWNGAYPKIRILHVNLR